MMITQAKLLLVTAVLFYVAGLALIFAGAKADQPAFFAIGASFFGVGTVFAALSAAKKAKP